MKENKARPWLSSPWSSTGARHLPGRRSSTRTPRGWSSTTATTATSGRSVGEPELQGARATRTTRRRAGSSCGFRSPKGSATRSAASTSPATRSSRPTACKPLFKLKPGDYYSEKRIRKGFEKAQEIYGAGGYFEFTGFPGLQVPRRSQPDRAATRRRRWRRRRRSRDGAADRRRHDADAGRQAVLRQPHHLHRQHDDARQRDPPRDAAGTRTASSTPRRSSTASSGSTSSATSSRSKAGKDVDVEKTPATTNKVDVKLKLEEQNRNQLTFGAGVSQFEGFFGQLSFQTANFLGRGESLTLSLQAGSRAQNYSLAFTEPFLFDRNITGGVNLFKRDVRYIGQFTQQSTGGVVTFGLPAGAASRACSRTTATSACASPRSTTLYHGPGAAARAIRSCATRCSSAQDGERIISKVTPSIVYNTVDQPIFPTTGKRFTASIDLAGLGGNTNFYKPTRRGRLVLAAEQPDVARLARRSSSTSTRSAGSHGAADLREAVPRRRVQRPRLRPPHHRAAGSDHRPRARRQQEPAVQRRAADSRSPGRCA